MTTRSRIVVAYDPTLRKHRASCPRCGFEAVREESQLAWWAVVRHVNDVHVRPEQS